MRGLSEQAPALTRRRKWLFRLTALVLVPLLIFGGLEAALRLAGYGYHTSFFEKIRVGRQEFLVNNENFSLRFFPPQLMRWPGPIRMDARKSTDTYRIFILGESAAQGDPEPAYGAWRYLEMLLRERYPGQPSRSSASQSPPSTRTTLPLLPGFNGMGDLWIVYVGTTKMVGPSAPPRVPASATASGLCGSFKVQQTQSPLLALTPRESKRASWRRLRCFSETSWCRTIHAQGWCIEI